MSTASASIPVTPGAERAPQRQVHVRGYLPEGVRDFTGPLQIVRAEFDYRTGGIVIRMESGDECRTAVTLGPVQSRAYAWRLKNGRAELERGAFDGGEPPAGELRVQEPERPIRSLRQEIFVEPDRLARCIRFHFMGGPSADVAHYLVSGKMYPTEVEALLFDLERCHDQQDRTIMRKEWAP